MSVNLGFGGQQFIPESVAKIKTLRRHLKNMNMAPAIAVDGGINLETAPKVIAAGANIIVAGSAIFGAKDAKKMITALRG